MITETVKGATAEKAYGKKLDTPIAYDYSFEKYENKAEIVAANDVPSDDEIVAMRNNERKLKARNEALTAALKAAGYEKPTLETSELLQLQSLVRTFKARGDSEEQARIKALKALDIAAWPEND